MGVDYFQLTPPERQLIDNFLSRNNGSPTGIGSVLESINYERAQNNQPLYSHPRYEVREVNGAMIIRDPALDARRREYRLSDIARQEADIMALEDRIVGGNLSEVARQQDERRLAELRANAEARRNTGAADNPDAANAARINANNQRIQELRDSLLHVENGSREGDIRDEIARLEADNTRIQNTMFGDLENRAFGGGDTTTPTQTAGNRNNPDSSDAARLNANSQRIRELEDSLLDVENAPREDEIRAEISRLQQDNDNIRADMFTRLESRADDEAERARIRELALSGRQRAEAESRRLQELNRIRERSPDQIDAERINANNQRILELQAQANDPRNADRVGAINAEIARIEQDTTDTQNRMFARLENTADAEAERARIRDLALTGRERAEDSARRVQTPTTINPDAADAARINENDQIISMLQDELVEAEDPALRQSILDDIRAVQADNDRISANMFARLEDAAFPPQQPSSSGTATTNPDAADAARINANNQRIQELQDSLLDVENGPREEEIMAEIRRLQEENQTIQSNMFTRLEAAADRAARESLCTPIRICRGSWCGEESFQRCLNGEDPTSIREQVQNMRPAQLSDVRIDVQRSIQGADFDQQVCNNGRCTYLNIDIPVGSQIRIRGDGEMEGMYDIDVFDRDGNYVGRFQSSKRYVDRAVNWNAVQAAIDTMGEVNAAVDPVTGECASPDLLHAAPLPTGLVGDNVVTLPEVDTSGEYIEGCEVLRNTPLLEEHRDQLITCTRNMQSVLVRGLDRTDEDFRVNIYHNMFTELNPREQQFAARFFTVHGEAANLSTYDHMMVMKVLENRKRLAQNRANENDPNRELYNELDIALSPQHFSMYDPGNNGWRRAFDPGHADRITDRQRSNIVDSIIRYEAGGASIHNSITNDVYQYHNNRVNPGWAQTFVSWGYDAQRMSIGGGETEWQNGSSYHLFYRTPNGRGVGIGHYRDFRREAAQ
jgi:hypothetical protein